jgi:ABC-type antimicrobial peptide transport system permease subunit
MNKNMGNTDRVIRTILAVIVGILILAGTLTGLAAVILGILAVVFLLTSLVSTCPLYVPFKISTKPKDTAAK